MLSDTHCMPGRSRRLPDAAYAALETADLILHAGDITTRHLLDELEAFAPVLAVLGNNDHELIGLLPETRELTLGGVRVAMVHDSGHKDSRAARMRTRFPDADIVIFGHSHEPCAQRTAEGLVLFNPGSPTERRRAPEHTIGVLDIADGALQRYAVVSV
ncbi:MAG: metallophosphoesterase family protein [Acidimicrobiia bacterium]